MSAKVLRKSQKSRRIGNVVHKKDDDCLLCGSRKELSQIRSDYRAKWCSNICSLYEIVDPNQIHQVEQILDESSFCWMCYQDLREIENLYTSISRFNSKLQYKKLECQAKLKDTLGSTSLPNTGLSSVSYQHPQLAIPVEQPVGEEAQKEHYKRSQREKLFGCMKGDLDSSIPQETITSRDENYSENDNIDLVEMEVEADRSPEFDLLSVIENIGLVEEHGIEKTANAPSNSVSQRVTFDNCVDVIQVTPEQEESLRRQRAIESQKSSEDGTLCYCTHPGCRMKFSVPARLDGHFNRAHKADPRPFKCLECTCSFITYNELLDHANVHLGLNPFICQDCDKACATKLRLQRHIRRHHRPQGAECQYCGKKFLYAGKDLERHVKSHTTAKNIGKLFYCEICNIPFCSVLILHRHLNGKHRDSDAFGKAFKFRCRYCPKSFTTNYLLKIHESSHPEYQPEEAAPKATDKTETSAVNSETNPAGTEPQNSESTQDSTPPEYQGDQPMISANVIETTETEVHDSAKDCHDRNNDSDETFQKNDSRCRNSSENSAINDEDNVWSEKEQYDNPCGNETNRHGEVEAAVTETPQILATNLPGEDREESESFRTLRNKYNLKPCSIKVNKVKVGSQKLKRAIEQARLKNNSSSDSKPRLPIQPSKDGDSNTSAPDEQNYLCTYQKCKSSFLNKLLLEVHIKKKHLAIRRPYECDTCHTFWASQKEMMEHQNVHLGLSPFDCTECGEKFATRSILGQHRRKAHRSKNVSCEHCGKEFQYACANYRVHVQRHLNKKPFSCDRCGSSFYAKAELTSHKRNHHPEDVKGFPCQLCGKSYSRPQFLKRHQLLMHASSSTGGGRGRGGAKAKSVRGSMSIKSSNSRKVKNFKSYLITQYKCDVCGFKAGDQEKLDNHLSTEHSHSEFLQSFKCDVCGLAFKRFSERNRHKRVEHGIVYAHNITL